VVGIIENMSGLICPHCGERIDLFKTGGGERAAAELKVALTHPQRSSICPKRLQEGKIEIRIDE